MTIATPIPESAFSVNPERARNYSYHKKVGNYLLGRQVGQGSFAKVKEGLHTITGERVAVKIIDQEKCKTDAYVRKNLRKEAKLLQLLRHENIVQLYEIMETQNSYYLVMELCSGELMQHILKSKSLSEFETRKYLRQIIKAVYYMHQAGVMHRDLKIENLLIGEKDDIKIIDFGLSTQVKTSSRSDGHLISSLCRTQCGSPAYAAPEVLAKRPYSIAADVWSVGINMYAMLVGSLPFTCQPFNIKGLCQKMMNGEMNSLPVNLSRGARDLLYRLLNPNPEERIPLKDAMAHPWLNDGSPLLNPSPYPNRLKVNDIVPEVTRYMTKALDFRMGDTVRLLMLNSPHHASAVYHLLVRKLRRYCRQHKISWPLRNTATASQESLLEMSVGTEEVGDDVVSGMAKASVVESGRKTEEDEKEQPSFGLCSTGKRILSRRAAREPPNLCQSDKENDPQSQPQPQPQEPCEQKKHVTFRDIPPISAGQRAAQRRLVIRRQSDRIPPDFVPNNSNNNNSTPLPELGPKPSGTAAPLKTHLLDARAITMILPTKRLFQYKVEPANLTRADTALELTSRHHGTSQSPNRSLRRTLATAGTSGSTRNSRFSAPATQVVRYSLDVRSGAKQLISDSEASRAGSLPAGHG